MENKKRKILITGASGGLMQAVLKDFDRKKYTLALQYNNKKPDCSNEDYCLASDFSSDKNLEQFWNTLTSEWGSPDIIIHAAGVTANGISWKLKKEDWQKCMQINLNTPFFLTQKAIPAMRKNQFGRVVFFSSIVAHTGFVGASAYGASKSALSGLTKSLSIELASSQITVNTIAPGYFNAGMINEVPEDMQNDLLQKIPVNRFGNTSELKGLIDYLISKEGAYITGQTLNINGGLYG